MTAFGWTALGLLFNLAGVVILFWFGMPFRLPVKGALLFAWGQTLEGEHRDRVSLGLSWAGLLLIAAATFMQMRGAYLA